jgi:hypothetical protein
MKALGVISTAAIFLLFGAMVPAFAQEEHHEEAAKPAQHEEQAKPAAKQEQAKPQKQEEQAKPAKQEQAKPQKQQQAAKPAKQEQAKPQKQEQQAKPEKQQQEAKGQKQQQQQAKSSKQEQQQQVEGQQQQQRQQQGNQREQAQGQWARNGQKDSRGHEYHESRFGRDHHARFEQNGGRFYNGRREYPFGGYWFYAGVYPQWFYQQDVYFVMGADGLWYAVAYNDPSLTFQVSIE